MCIDHPLLAICAVIGCSIAIITAVLIGQPHGAIECGCASFHGMLVGIILAASLDKGSYFGHATCAILLIIAMCTISAYLASGLDNIFGQLCLTSFNLAFVVALFMFIPASTVTPGVTLWMPMESSPSLPASKTFGNVTVDWFDLLKAIPLASVQIYGPTIITRVLIFISMCVNSTITCINAILAPLLSIFTALAFAAPPVQIYKGSLIYDAMLTCCCLVGFFCVISIQRKILSMVSVVFKICRAWSLGQNLWISMHSNGGFPVCHHSFHLPGHDQCKPVYEESTMNDVTFPELHYLVYYPEHATEEGSMQ